MKDAAPLTEDGRQRLVLVTGPSGAGRSTAVHALEDLGFEAIDNLPLSLLPRLIDGPALTRPIALGLDVRNRDFTIEALIEVIDRLAARADIAEELLYVDADEDTLVRRYSETRRRHPLADNSPLHGIRREREMLVPIRARADVLIETGGLSPHDLRAEIEGFFAPPEGKLLTVELQSFSYKRGLPRGLDFVFDCRFLRNPHWEPTLRESDGRDAAVAKYVVEDRLFEPFFTQLCDLFGLILPAVREEGKTHLAIGFGCTGGQHRSVALAERLANALAVGGWQVSKRHRELERRAEADLPGRGEGR